MVGFRTSEGLMKGKINLRCCSVFHPSLPWKQVCSGVWAELIYRLHNSRMGEMGDVGISTVFAPFVWTVLCVHWNNLIPIRGWFRSAYRAPQRHYLLVLHTVGKLLGNLQYVPTIPPFFCSPSSLLKKCMRFQLLLFAAFHLFGWF